MKLTKALVKDAFSRKTFERGYNYFKEGYVTQGIDFQDRIWGMVAGSRRQPYRVSVLMEENQIVSECSCPVGYMCKHGVALALRWVKEPGSFLEVKTVMDSLREKSKEELIVVLEDVLGSNPALIYRFELAFQMADPGRMKINLEAMERRITYALSGDLDYYHIDGAVEELEEICGTAGSLEERSRFMDAARLYMLLVEGCTNAYERGADDSNGSIGGLAQDCISLFNDCMEKVEDPGFRDAMLMRVAQLYEREDYGLETEDMFLGVATETNIERIEDELNRQLKDYLKRHRGRDGWLADYKRREVKGILTELYEKIGRIDEALELVRSEMRDAGDHVHLADILIRAGRYEEALGTLKECRKFKNSKKNRELADGYLRLVEALMREGQSDKVDIQEAMEFATVLIGTPPWWFDRKEYDRIRSVFKELDAHERLISYARERFAGTSTLAEILLYEKDTLGAAETLDTMKEVRGELAMRIAAKSKSEGLTDVALRMTSLALRSGYSPQYKSADREVEELVSEFLTSASKEDLKDMVLSLQVEKDLSSFIAEELAVRAPGLVRLMIKDDMEAYEFGDLMRIMDRLVESRPTDAQYLANLWVSEFVVRSHVYYDKAIKMLKLMKKAILKMDGETDWKEYISSFEGRYRTRKMLMKKLAAEGLIRQW